MRRALVYACYGIGIAAYWVYDRFMVWSHEIQGDTLSGPWRDAEPPVSRETEQEHGP